MTSPQKSTSVWELLKVCPPQVPVCVPILIPRSGLIPKLPWCPPPYLASVSLPPRQLGDPCYPTLPRKDQASPEQGPVVKRMKKRAVSIRHPSPRPHSTPKVMPIPELIYFLLKLIATNDALRYPEDPAV